MSTPLTNPNHEKFCLAIAEGKTGREAITLAGYTVATPAYADKRAYTLRLRPDIQTRITELQKAAETASVLTTIEKRQRLARIVRIPYTEIIKSPEKYPDLIKTTRTIYDKDGNEIGQYIETFDPLRALAIDNSIAPETKDTTPTETLAAALAALTTSRLPTGKI